MNIIGSVTATIASTNIALCFHGRINFVFFFKFCLYKAKCFACLYQVAHVMFFFCSVLKQILFINNWFVWLRYYIGTSCCMCTCFFFLIITVLLERVENLPCCKLFIVFYLLECLRFTMYRHVPLRMESTSSRFQATDLLVCMFGSAACAFSFLRYVLFYLLWIVTVTKFLCYVDC